MNGIFVTATDTETGKTIISGHIASAICSLGYDAGVMKPVASGCVCKKDPVTGEEKLISEDAELLAKLSGSTDPLEEITPLCFREPLAPMPAAQIENRPVDLDLVRQAWTRLSARHEFMVVEGIGGVMVPITAGYYLLDMIVEFGLPALVVTRAGLGTLNHTILTVNTLRANGVEVAGLIMNECKPSERGPAEKTNPAVLEKCLDLSVICTIPHLQDPLRPHPIFVTIAKHLLNIAD
jgi:dethiobiotin synthetase